MPEQPDDDLASRAWQAWKHSVETGDPEPLLELCADDLRFVSPIPVGEFQGEQVGKDRVAALTRWRYDSLQMRATMTLLSTARGEGVAGFEWQHDGTNGGEPYHNRLAIFFGLEDGRVASWREYVNEVDPAAVARAAAATA